MDVVLVPGFWLDASSWDGVRPAIEAAGHRVHAVTLPGLESVDADRTDIGLRDHIDAVIRLVDEIGEPVVLVGHSGGAPVIQGAIDARPDRVVRGVYVDSVPLPEGGVVNNELPVVDGEIPLPDWSEFPDEDLVDLSDDLRTEFRARSIPQPRGAAFDQQHLHDDRRYDVPVTVIACEFPSAMMLEWIAAEYPEVAELGRVRHVDYFDLPTGHWPQFTRPVALGAAILAAVQTPAP